MSSTSPTPFLITRLPLTASILFVNFRWMIDLFEFSHITTRQKFVAEVSDHVMNKSLPGQLTDFLVRLAKNPDDMEAMLDRRPDLTDKLGLTSTLPDDGYPQDKSATGILFNPFMSCLLLNHCLWALGLGGELPSGQWYHPATPDAVEDMLNFSTEEECIKVF
ncbi:hypothetical protein K439DRAFT_1616914 [Ramaria rubella]|nr:hypothetical protein K439DRAFT_1616914 [Ramaria rubella]